MALLLILILTALFFGFIYMRVSIKISSVFIKSYLGQCGDKESSVSASKTLDKTFHEFHKTVKIS